MTPSQKQVEEIFERRNRCFMEADIESYMAMWAEDGFIELDGVRAEGKSSIRAAVADAWEVATVLLMETRSCAAHGNTLLNEFSIVWRHKGTGLVTLQTGMGVIELNDEGRWTCLRDYFDASSGSYLDDATSTRVSALNSAAVARLLESAQS